MEHTMVLSSQTPLDETLMHMSRVLIPTLPPTLQLEFLLDLSDFARSGNSKNLLEFYNLFTKSPKYPESFHFMVAAEIVKCPGVVQQLPSHPLTRRGIKRLRVNRSVVQSTMVYQCPNENCRSLDVIEDVEQGHVVCTQCGIILNGWVIDNAITCAPFPPEGSSKIVVHRYSRLTYLHSIIQSVQGATNCEVDPLDLQIIVDHCVANQSFSPLEIKNSIRLFKLPYRLMRHATSIAGTLWPRENLFVPQIGRSELTLMIRRFREFENAWDSPRSGTFKGSRKYFFNYRILWEYIANEQGLEHIADIFPPRSKKKEKDRVRQSQLKLIECIKKVI